MDLIHVCCFVLSYALESELSNVRHGSFNYKPAGNLSQNSLSLSVFFLFLSFFSLSAHFCAVDSTHAGLWASGLTFAFTSAL